MITHEPTSTKTRIKTNHIKAVYHQKTDLTNQLPQKQGLRPSKNLFTICQKETHEPTSTKTRIKTFVVLWQ